MMDCVVCCGPCGCKFGRGEVGQIDLSSIVDTMRLGANRPMPLPVSSPAPGRDHSALGPCLLWVVATFAVIAFTVWVDHNDLQFKCAHGDQFAMGGRTYQCNEVENVRLD